jgi:DNA-binding IclR family transcriptional regulator
MVKKGEWTLLSNHGRILVYLASNPKSTVQVMAQETGLSIGAVNKIVNTLEIDGYISSIKEGRCKSYQIHTNMPLRHRLEQAHKVGEILSIFGNPLDRNEIQTAK